MIDSESMQALQAMAEATAKIMFERDQASQALGMQIVSMAPGSAKLTMQVRSDMLNGHTTCHGGFVFILADSAFAFACNSCNRNTVASGCSIDYLAPAYVGDILSAQAIEQSRAGRTGIYDVIVCNQSGKRIALFRGKSYQIKGEVLEDPMPTKQSLES